LCCDDQDGAYGNESEEYARERDPLIPKPTVKQPIAQPAMQGAQ